MRTPAPTSERELMARANSIAGLSLAELALQNAWQIPTSLRRAKGWVGALLEAELGASAGSAPEPDFQAIGIELKTIPVRRDGRQIRSGQDKCLICF